MPQPVLRTERLLLVPLAERHVDLQVGLDSDPEVHRYITGRARTPAEVATAHAERLAPASRVDGLGYWAAFVTDGGTRGSTSPPDEDAGEFVGLMMLPPARGTDQPSIPGVAELGYRLVRRYWRRGLAGEASRELLRYAFDEMGRTRVVAHTMAVNAASRATMRSLGMRHVRTYFPSVDEPVPGAEQGEVEYEITREDREASRLSESS